MDDDADLLIGRRIRVLAPVVVVCAAVSALAQQSGPPAVAPTASAFEQILSILPPSILAVILLLIVLSGFFSASEVAFFAIHRVRLRSLAESGGMTGRLVASLLEHPSRLLTTILIGNMVVNVLVSVIMPPRLESIFVNVAGLNPAAGYIVTVVASTFVLVFFGEITPKVFAVRVSEFYARAVVLPLVTVDYLFGPLRWALIRFTEFVFRVTRIDDIKAAPFITDEEFVSVLSESEAKGVIEEEEGQMIQGILEFGDAAVKEILVPRPDVIAVPDTATVGEALEMFSKHEFSRMPVYDEDVDHVVGVLHAKDLLACVGGERLDEAIRPLARKANFVPVTMTIRGFVEDAQRKRAHLAIVADEYGGTEGIVTLDDAIEEVVGDIQDEQEHADPQIVSLGDGVFEVDGGVPLGDLSDIIGIDLKDEEHETVAGFIMDQTNSIPEKGDEIEHRGALFTVREVDGKRLVSLRVAVSTEPEERSAATEVES